MTEHGFRFVCVASALAAAPPGWARDMLLHDGEIALLADSGGLEAISRVAHALEVPSASVIRAEETPERQEAAVMQFAGSLPLVWVAGGFGEAARTWARERGPMTLLVEAGEPLPEAERRRIDRFVATLGRQSE